MDLDPILRESVESMRRVVDGMGSLPEPPELTMTTEPSTPPVAEPPPTGSGQAAPASPAPASPGSSVVWVVAGLAAVVLAAAMARSATPLRTAPNPSQVAHGPAPQPRPQFFE